LVRFFTGVFTRADDGIDEKRDGHVLLLDVIDPRLLFAINYKKSR
jgi:hypothetical protein